MKRLAAIAVTGLLALPGVAVAGWWVSLDLTHAASYAHDGPMPKRSSKSTDLNKRAFQIVEEATSEAQPDPDSGKDPAAVALGRKGGLKGGPARAKKLSKKARVEIAKKAADARWKGRDQG